MRDGAGLRLGLGALRLRSEPTSATWTGCELPPKVSKKLMRQNRKELLSPWRFHLASGSPCSPCACQTCANLNVRERLHAATIAGPGLRVSPDDQKAPTLKGVRSSSHPAFSSFLASKEIMEGPCKEVQTVHSPDVNENPSSSLTSPAARSKGSKGTQPTEPTESVSTAHDCAALSLPWPGPRLYPSRMKATAAPARLRSKPQKLRGEHTKKHESSTPQRDPGREA